LLDYLEEVTVEYNNVSTEKRLITTVIRQQLGIATIIIIVVVIAIQ